MPHPEPDLDLSDCAANRWAWRAIDISLSSVGLVVFAPLLITVAIAVRASGPGPVFFRQDRVGRHGRVFRIWKFRTMFVGTGDSLGVTAANDSRVTSVGRWLRAFKLDELPQLLNVVTGQMSIVGPRPDVLTIWAALPADCRGVLNVRPGITCTTTLMFDHETTLMSERERPEEYYLAVIAPAKMRLARDEFATARLSDYLSAVRNTLRRSSVHDVDKLRSLINSATARD
jgi:lipopolysaccharide/colanic/teichoic acid biosynthesis glycosyltransferase